MNALKRRISAGIVKTGGKNEGLTFFMLFSMVFSGIKRNFERIFERIDFMSKPDIKAG